MLNSLYWALAAGLGWGFGSVLGAMAQLPGVVGGTIGLALAMLAILTATPGKQSHLTLINLAAFGGAAAGSATLTLVGVLGREWSAILGGGAGFLIGTITSIMHQYFAPVRVTPACAIAVAGAGLFTGAGLLVGGVVGWCLAGAISLFAVALVAEYWRCEPAVEIDAAEQPVRVIPRGEMCRYIVRQSWSFTDPLAWGWNGAAAGLLASLWALWAADRASAEVADLPLLVCGSLAAAAILAGRLGILKKQRSVQQ
jgi:hypothetical protein